jgi:hypothetical protein
MIAGFRRFIRTVAIFDLGLFLGIDGIAKDDFGSPVCGDQRKGRIDRTRGGAGSGSGGHGSNGERADTGADCNSQEMAPVRRRVCGWRAKHAISLGHLDYRVVVRDGDEFEIGSIGAQFDGWTWGIDTVVPMKEVEAQGTGKDRADCMRQFRAAWDRFSSDPARLTEFLENEAEAASMSWSRRFDEPLELPPDMRAEVILGEKEREQLEW